VILEVTRANFGESVSPRGLEQSNDVLVRVNEREWLLGDELREVPAGIATWKISKPATGPFDIADFGDRDRLAWKAGACAIDQQQQLSYWADRYAVWSEHGALVIVDATRPDVLRVRTSTLIDTSLLVIHGGKVWLYDAHGIVSIAWSSLVALFDQRPGPLVLAVRETYPRRRPGLAVRARVELIDATLAHARALDPVRELKFPVVAGVKVGLEVTLHDELWRDLFLGVELPGRPRRRLYGNVATERTFEASFTLEPAIDPASGLADITREAPSRQDVIDRLFGEVADRPDEPDARSILVDILEEAGEPYAPQFAALIAGNGDDGDRRTALGPLCNYLEYVKYRGGLPWCARLSRNAPNDEGIGDAVAADLRLGLFHTLRLGDGAVRIYAKLVGSRRAVGLRCVDVPQRQILAELIVGARDQLTRLCNVRFTTREMLELLAHPTFDRARVLETETTVEHYAKLLRFVARDEAKLFARAPRHLVVTERDRADDALIEPVLAAWERLPLAELTVAGLTFSRDGATTIVRAAAHASSTRIGQIRARYKVLT
jgi:hypothetical protein